MKGKRIREEDISKLEKDQEYAKVMAKEINSLELEEAKERYNNLIVITNNGKLMKACSWFIYYLAWVYFDMLDLAMAIKLHKEALQNFTDLNVIDGKLACINGLIGSYIKLQMFDDAIEIALEGIELGKRYKNYESIGIIKSNLLCMYADMEEYQKGIEVYEEIQELEYIGDWNNEIVNCLNRSICELGIHHIEKAKEYAEKAYDIAVEYSSRLIPQVLSVMANVYIELGLYDMAMEKLEDASNYIKDDSNGEAFVCVLKSLGDLELKRENYKEAIKNYTLVYEKVYNNKWRNELKIVCNKLSQAYKGIEEYKKANRYLEKYIEVDKEIRLMNSNKKLEVLNERKSEEVERTYKALYSQTEKLYKFGKMITSTLQKEDILNIIAEEIKLVMNYDGIQIALCKEEGVFEYQLFVEQGKRIDSKPVPLDYESFGGYCIRNKKEILMNDIRKDFYKYVDWEKYMSETMLDGVKDEECRSAIFVPIIIKDKAIGVISVQCYKKNQYNLKDLSTLRIISSFIGIALENARLYKRIQYLAIYDDLLNIFNKREIMRRGYDVYSGIEGTNHSFCYDGY